MNHMTLMLRQSIVKILGVAPSRNMSGNKLYSDEELKERLTKEQYNVCIKKGTEPSFTGEYNDHKGDGVYKCVVCGHNLFSSVHKYNSGSGWPSFYDTESANNVATSPDDSIPGRARVEISCEKCDSHLGHVFEDGPKPTGLRYCVNSLSLKFQGKDDSTK